MDREKTQNSRGNTEYERLGGASYNNNSQYNNTQTTNKTMMRTAMSDNFEFNAPPLRPPAKLGNTSQSIISVPNIFFNRDLKKVETFNTEKKYRYFKEKELLAQAQQLNINNNPMKNNRKFEDYNKKKYHAINKVVASQIEPTNSFNIHYNRNYYDR